MHDACTAPGCGAQLGMGLGEFKDLVGSYLPTKFGAHLIIISSSFGTHKFNDVWSIWMGEKPMGRVRFKGGVCGPFRWTIRGVPLSVHKMCT